MSPAVAASTAGAARASGPSSPTRAARGSGPRELLITTGYPREIARLAPWLPMGPGELPITPGFPREIASLATWLPMCPAPMNPIGGFPNRNPSSQTSAISASGRDDPSELGGRGECLISPGMPDPQTLAPARQLA